MKRSRREFSMKMVTNKILKIPTLSPCFTFIPKTGMVQYLKQGFVFTVYLENISFLLETNAITDLGSS